MKRYNLYLDEAKLRTLRVVAASESMTVSDLVREAIDRIITDRLSGKKRSSSENLQDRLNRFFEHVAQKISASLSEEEIDERVLGPATPAVRRPW
ncbi:hypothetical protein EPN42_05185 [bacterium]|nr:MAG: hypothetical protein EPN42_05185 [bacterium]